MEQHGATPLPIELGLAGCEGAVQGPEEAQRCCFAGQKEMNATVTGRSDLVYQVWILLSYLALDST